MSGTALATDSRRSDRAPGWVDGVALAALAGPVLSLGAAPPLREVLTTIAAVLVAAVVAVGVDRAAGGRRSRPRRLAGLCVVAASSVAAIVTPAGLATAIIGALLGAGVGLAAGGREGGLRRIDATTAWSLGAGLALVVAVRLLLGDDPVARWLPTLMVAVAVVPGLRSAGPTTGPDPDRVRRRWTVGVVLGAAAGLLAWTGANDPQLSWFGPVVSSGPRDVPAVALTFDDGPNDPFSLEIARVLEERGARGTFYLVGSAIDRDPAIVRELVDRGHQVGNHSYHHDYWRWLDPRYPELERTNAAFERAIGRCPTTYRPPHGQRTPFISALVAADGMRTITWDTSAMDWSLTDGSEVARRVLDRVQPGSIVLLHDGLDGVAGADRQVVLDALPIILDGLAERGLRPVSVDELVDTGGSLQDC